VEHIPAQAWIAFFALLVTIFIAAGGVIWTLVWKLSDIQASLTKSVDEKIKEHVADRNRAITTLRTELIKSDETVRQNVAEVSHAVTSKIQQIELYIRDQLKEYVLKEDFRDDLETVTKIIDTLGNRIEKRLESFEEKLDRLEEYNLEALKR